METFVLNIKNYLNPDQIQIKNHRISADLVFVNIHLLLLTLDSVNGGSASGGGSAENDPFLSANMIRFHLGKKNIAGYLFPTRSEVSALDKNGAASHFRTLTRFHGMQRHLLIQTLPCQDWHTQKNKFKNKKISSM